ncbi:hypothetical protein SAMN02745975_02580 [Geosporobacter subterraneus DSM 17957]|uniref:Uncharacterized protein n=1 Tax=Geosporobacter subterraneus DSM 17957 TaxID=1121919 RepID=A0A1M6L4W3_9FIRM|nr:hypothetical protein [Geosporobacter subterraneus]SHJ66257.1 hypothetical protein SAMN02745975_02580 [Geosporobacter subterraneus DSM 17957]
MHGQQLVDTILERLPVTAITFDFFAKGVVCLKLDIMSTSVK